MNKKLTGISETMLIPLWARAFETDRENPIVNDPKAREMVSRIDYDFKKFQKSWLSQLGVAIRTMLLDNAILTFIRDNQDAWIVNLGAGLDTRYERIGKESVKCWYDLDVPESIALRKQFFTESSRNRFVATSAYDFSWINEINPAQAILIVAEGLLMYFSEDENKALFRQLAEKLSGAQMLFEMMAPAAVGKSRRHDALKKIDNTPEFKWGIKNSREMESWHHGIQFVQEWNLVDYHKDRWRWPGYIARMPFIKPRVSQRIVHINFS
ncbi:class I SAM-dependent methyltransferase [uncultured Desulfobacter sp.]|uniref:class I SAM-dependent methyltransferase n=1 Tax=uncultured Desulfobacter sp. TaxID=240139 RepID=UPI0029C725C4|nr:class I SAM-dependent methyltransferase [uncultured Desulfobacter sp.]